MFPLNNAWNFRLLTFLKGKALASYLLFKGGDIVRLILRFLMVTLVRRISTYQKGGIKNEY
jgi:hypothetical protein